MRLTLTLDDEVLAKAEECTGISDKSALIREALKTLVEREAARRLARLGGTHPDLKPIPRRRPKPKGSWSIHRSGSSICTAAMRSSRRCSTEAGVLEHPFVIGELALGNLLPRDTFLSDLRDLPQAIVAEDEEVLRMVNRQALFGRGIGYVDAQLAAARLTAGSKLWTHERRPQAVAAQLGLAAVVQHWPASRRSHRRRGSRRGAGVFHA
jgi:predicted nucleic acid-binding protein